LAEPASDSDGCAIFLVPSAVPAISARVSPRFRCLLALPVSAGFQVSPVAPLPPASPLIQISGCPSLRTSGFTGDRSSSRPDSLSFGGAGCESSRLPLRFAPPVSPTISIRVAPDAHPPVPADFRSESPRSSVPSGRPFRISRLLRQFALGFVVRPFPKSPWLLFAQRRRFRSSRVAPKLSSSADPYLHPQVAPASTSTAGSMITPWLNRTLHPRLAPWMNLRYQSGTSIPDLISSAP
jgi:hypothetical protein